jgi:hypothetical protein
MRISVRRVSYQAAALLLIFSIGFALSSGAAFNACSRISEKMTVGIEASLYHHVLTLCVVGAKHYFLFPTGNYTAGLITQPLSFPVLAAILFNSIFNILFQPVFLCPFTPQVIVNLVLLPFFLYGAVSYFRKTWLLLVIFTVLSFYIGVFDSGVEALIRHGMPCELIYLLIGLAGFTGWITKNS